MNIQGQTTWPAELSQTMTAWTTATGPIEIDAGASSSSTITDTFLSGRVEAVTEDMGDSFIGDGMVVEKSFFLPDRQLTEMPESLRSLVGGAWMADVPSGNTPHPAHYVGVHAGGLNVSQRSSAMGPKARYDLSSAGDKDPMLSDIVLEGMYRLALKNGLIRGEAFDMIVIDALLHFRPRLLRSELKAYLDQKYDFSRVSKLFFNHQLECLKREGVIELRIMVDPSREEYEEYVVSLSSTSRARTMLLNFKLRDKRAAEALGLIAPSAGSRPKVAPIPDISPALLIARCDDLRRRTEAIISGTAEFWNEGIRRGGRKLLKRINAMSARTPSQLADLDARLAQLEGKLAAYQGAKARVAAAAAQAAAPQRHREKMARDVDERDVVLTSDEVEIYLSELVELKARVMGDAGRKEPETRSEVDALLRRYRSRTAVRRSEMEWAIDRLEDALLKKKAARPMPSAVEAGVAGERAAQKTSVDWSGFPPTLKYRKARSILLKNGFVIIRSQGSHFTYGHIGHPEVSTMVVSNKHAFYENMRAEVVIEVLQDLVAAGEENVTW